MFEFFRIVQKALVVFLLIRGWASVAFGFSGGVGTYEDPFRISTVEDLLSITSSSELAGKCYVLVNDLDLDPNLPGGRVFDRSVLSSDGDDSEFDFSGNVFQGQLDGNGHRILNMTIEAAEVTGYIGLFGVIGDQADIKDLRLEAVRIKVLNEGIYVFNVGALVGRSFGVISRCSASVAIHVGGDRSESIGGLVGGNHGSMISCYSEGFVKAVNRGLRVGGLVGLNESNGLLVNSCTDSDVEVGPKSSSIGGLAGGNNCGVSSCYSTGQVLAGDESEDIGGLIGNNVEAVHGCFWDIDTSEMIVSDGGIGLSSAHMMDPQTFLQAGWDFVDECANGLQDV